MNGVYECGVSGNVGVCAVSVSVYVRVFAVSRADGCDAHRRGVV